MLLSACVPLKARPTLAPLAPLAIVGRAAATAEVTAYASTTLRVRLPGSGDDERELVSWSTSDRDVAWVTSAGQVVFINVGRVTIRGQSRTAAATTTFHVVSSPVTRLALVVPTTATVGSPVAVRVVASDRAGATVGDVPVHLATSGFAVVTDDGQFIARAPGLYRLLAVVGEVATSTNDVAVLWSAVPMRIPMTRRGRKSRTVPE